jgi:hypothetical protein
MVPLVPFIGASTHLAAQLAAHAAAGVVCVHAPRALRAAPRCRAACRIRAAAAADSPTHPPTQPHTRAAISGKSLGTAFGINGAVCVVAVVVFSILRVRTFTRRFYMPRRCAACCVPRAACCVWGAAQLRVHAR